jgi:hypothetical protein
MSLVEVLKRFMPEDAGGELRQTLIETGAKVAEEYRLERLAPKWQDFLSKVLCAN